ncbi:hypothetical protein SAMN04488556_1576 [Halostagnicola kamekurae]|uniref:Uncharacterized protein n=1 Tax=Halostagnicola kamekurae TaxID=619731 RepID=A0A1I6QUG6_9EURY|nr:hypothetical protein SAMN04488556_1576 [Halostagnicola kamekurae]
MLRGNPPRITPSRTLLEPRNPSVLEEQPQIRRANRFLRLEAEPLEHLERPLACGFEIVVGGVGLDFDVFADAVDGVAGDRVALEVAEFEALASLANGRGGIEPEVSKHRVERLSVLEARFYLLAGLGLVVHERAFVRHDGFGILFVDGALPTNPERLVGFGERPVWRVVVRVRLDDGPERSRLEFGQSITNPLEIGGDFHFDLVHARLEAERR